MVKFRITLTVLILFSAGCASSSLQKARVDFYSGNLVRADRLLDECNGISKKDHLLCYMEKGTIIHYMGAYPESTEVLLKASRLIKEQDIINISDQSSAVLVNDKVMEYKGEYSERLWVHTFLMMNFLLQYKYESALVEAKQALEVYDEYPDSLETDYFTRALIALCFENMNLPDDARIEYDKLAEAMDINNFMPEPIARGKGELVLFIAQGRVSTKVSTNIVIPPSTRISIPRYTDSSSPLPVTIRPDRNINIPLQIMTDLGDVAQKSLNDRAVQYLARQALRVGAKESIARKVGKKDELAEALVRIILFLSEEADTRSWETLPGSLTLIRIILDSGMHDLEISSEYSETAYLNGVDIPEGRRVYQSIRF